MAAQVAVSAPLDSAQYTRVVEGLKAMQDIAADLDQWALLVLGGTLAVMLSTSYRKPGWPWRGIYFLLLPALGCLGWSLQQGSYVRRTYAAMLLRPPGREPALDALTGANSALDIQITTFEWAVVVLALWLLAYLVWWMFVDGKRKETSDVPE